MRALLAASAAITLIGCAQPTWNKPGASQSDFSKDRYSCAQDSQQRVGTAAVNQFGGAASNSMQTNEMLYGTCMNSHGWYLQRPAQPFAAAGSSPGPSPAQVSNQSEIDAANKEMADSYTVACADPAYQAIWAKSACRLRDVTLSQRADKSMLTDVEKPAFEASTKQTVDRQRKALAVMKRAGNAKSQQYAVIVETSMARVDTASMNLFVGKSTWGEYSIARVESGRIFEAEWAKARAQ